MTGEKTASGDPAVPADSIFLRILSSLVLIPIVLASVHFGGRLFSALVAFACIIMLFEWTRMVERRSFSHAFYVLAICAAVSLFLAGSGLYGPAFLLCAVSGVAAYFISQRSGGSGLWPAIGALYIAAPSIALLWLRIDTDAGRLLTYFLFAAVWAGDTGAYTFGKLVGGPKFNPALSPAKTWAGIIGGVIAGGAIGGAATYFIPGATPFFVILVGGCLGGASVLGDIVESGFKRGFGVKDISGFIPGHGGALDRMDGMIFATSAMTLVLFIYKVIG